jgi:hypothetical protein
MLKHWTRPGHTQSMTLIPEISYDYLVMRKDSTKRLLHPSYL